MIKIIFALMILSSPAYSATGTGKMGAELHTSVFSMDYDDLKIFCAENDYVLNCEKALEEVRKFEEFEDGGARILEIEDAHIVIE